MTALEGVYIKINRAKKHLEGLESEVATFLSSQPYAIVMHPDPNTGHQSYRFSIQQTIPKHWAGIVGDIIHNLRSSLDYLSVALVIAHGVTSKTAINETYFPIGASKDTFSTKKIGRAHPTAIKIVERLKPYKGGMTDFWRLHQMDILDKHSLLIPVGAAFTHIGFRFPTPNLGDGGEMPILPPVFFRPQNRVYPIEDGTGVFSYNANSGPLPQPGDVQAVFHIAFGEGQIVDGEPLIPTLKQFIDFVERVVGIFQKKFFP